LERATSKVREVALYVNERTREAENLAKVYSIQNMLGSKIDVLGPNRKIVREGFLKQIYGNKGKKRPVYCVLFNDIIICCKVETKILTGTQKFECLEKIPLLDCAITQLVDDESKGHRNAFNVETRKAKLTLVSPSLSDREKWCKKLNRCAKDTLEKNKFYEDSKETVASQRAGEARALIAQKYTHYRVKGRDATTDGSCDPGVPGVRKFAERKKHFNSLTPVEKLDRTAVALEETDELLKEELRILEEREKEAEEKAGRVKESINRRYNTQNTSDDTSLDSSRTELVPPSNLRNWTLKRSPRPKDSSESELDRVYHFFFRYSMFVVFCFSLF
jgi:hypothetical protein